jgi:TonB family protein
VKTSLSILLLILLTINGLFGQVEDSSFKSIKTGNWLELSFKPINNKGETVPFISIEEMPEYPGGFDALAKFILGHLDYPKSAIRDSIEGRVLTSFIVDWEGTVTNVKTFRGVRNDLDSVCLAAISILPRWNPFKSPTNEEIRFQFILPIKFLLNAPKDIKHTKKYSHNKK